ncbi:MAG: precorrin-2 C(20)-methyltransferase, partial [Rhodospirillales bacterium]|nr:precorrin-2 C(20)-methyltransferase [Rhodospirillales bacterium]
MTAKGKLWGIGLGPGDPDLITLKALKILQAVDVVAYPAPLEGESFARSIAAPHLAGKQV